MWNEDPKTLTVDTRLKTCSTKNKGGKGHFIQKYSMKLQKPKRWGKIIPHGGGGLGDNINVERNLPTKFEENWSQTVMTKVQI